MMNKILCILLLLCLSTAYSLAQDKARPPFKDSVTHQYVYQYADKMPVPLGGIERFYASLMKEIRYPANLNSNISSKVAVGFIVEPDGKITGCRVIRDGTGHLLADQIFAIARNTKWKPGSLNRKKVPVLMLIPFMICLTQN